MGGDRGSEPFLCAGQGISASRLRKVCDLLSTGCLL